jgi:hypothetical protein
MITQCARCDDLRPVAQAHAIHHAAQHVEERKQKARHAPGSMHATPGALIS